MHSFGQCMYITLGCYIEEGQTGSHLRYRELLHWAPLYPVTSGINRSTPQYSTFSGCPIKSQRHRAGRSMGRM